MAYKTVEDRRAAAKRWREANPDYQRKWREKNADKKYTYPADKEYMREAQRKFRERNPGYRNKYTESTQRYLDNNRQKHNARTAVYRAIKSGRLVKPTDCDSCGIVAPLEADHADYTKPLEVSWLCKPCHVRITEDRKTVMI